jgi:hypothetical protein
MQRGIDGDHVATLAMSGSHSHRRKTILGAPCLSTREILEAYFAGKPIRTEYLIVDKGKLAGAGARSYTAGDATKGSEEAARM